MPIAIELRKLFIRSERSHNFFLILELGTAQPTDGQKYLETYFYLPATLPKKYRDDYKPILECSVSLNPASEQICLCHCDQLPYNITAILKHAKVTPQAHHSKVTPETVLTRVSS